MVLAERLTDSVAYHAEGAVWYDGWGGLKWVDMLAGAVLSLDSRTGEISRLETGSPVAAMVRPRAKGGLAVVTERELTLWNDGVRTWSSPALWKNDRRFNEGGCTPQGALLCGSMAYDRQPGAGEVYRFDIDGTAEALFGDVTISNGLGFTTDGRRMYYVDSPTRRIDVFDVDDDGIPSDRRGFVTIPDGAGNPDGLCVDEHDGIWVGLYNGSAVRHYDASGALQDVIELPVARITSCALGGLDQSTLFITTSRENLAAGEQPAAGSIFAAPAGVRGAPVRTFAG